MMKLSTEEIFEKFGGGVREKALDGDLAAKLKMEVFKPFTLLIADWRKRHAGASREEEALFVAICAESLGMMASTLALGVVKELSIVGILESVDQTTSLVSEAAMLMMIAFIGRPRGTDSDK